ncbi:MAG: hypothetical protein GDA51_02710 [Ekhidna sp.]|nr:hypothetical protein [Ekhidna sp.]
MRDLKDLEKNALRYWPSEIIEEEKDISIIPKLGTVPKSMIYNLFKKNKLV